MSREPYPLVWWWKKELPHRFGQRCVVGNLARHEGDEEAWRGEVWRIEFEDGGVEWANKRGARRPNRLWKGRFEHEREHCTGHWHRVQGGYGCDKCEAWVRNSDEARSAYEAASRMDMAIHGIVQENRWMEFIAEVRAGMEPIELARWLTRLRLAWPYQAGYAGAMRRNNVKVTWDEVRVLLSGEEP